MNLSILSHDPPPPPGLPAQAEALLLERLGPHRRAVTRVTASLSRGCCRIVVQLAPSGALAVEARDPDSPGAVRQATDAALGAVARELARRRGRPLPAWPAYAGME